MILPRPKLKKKNNNNNNKSNLFSDVWESKCVAIRQ